MNSDAEQSLAGAGFALHKDYVVSGNAAQQDTVKSRDAGSDQFFFAHSVTPETSTGDKIAGATIARQVSNPVLSGKMQTAVLVFSRGGLLQVLDQQQTSRAFLRDPDQLIQCESRWGVRSGANKLI